MQNKYVEKSFTETEVVAPCIEIKCYNMHVNVNGNEEHA